MVNEILFKKLIIYSLIAVLIAISLIVLWPIFLSVITGLILAYMLYPVYKLVFKVIREKNISALIIVLLVIFLLFIPIWFVFPIMLRQLVDIYIYTQTLDFSIILKGIVPESLSKDTMMIITTFISKVANEIFSRSSETLLNIPNLALQAVVILFVFFFAMRDLDKLKVYVKKLSPFSQEFEKSISKQFRDVTGSVIYGQIIVGIVQGLITGIGLFIFGIPNALVLTIMAMFLSVLPIIGAWLVWLPASIYLLAQGHTGAAIGLFAYGAILVSWIDNIIKPYIVARKTKTSSAIILIGMIGGLIVFGIIGLVLGPLILLYLIIILDAYQSKNLAAFFSPEKNSKL